MKPAADLGLEPGSVRGQGEPEPGARYAPDPVTEEHRYNGITNGHPTSWGQHADTWRTPESWGHRTEGGPTTWGHHEAIPAEENPESWGRYETDNEDSDGMRQLTEQLTGLDVESDNGSKEAYDWPHGTDSLTETDD